MKRRAVAATPLVAEPQQSSFLGAAIFISLLVHGLLLGMHFSYPNASRVFQEKALDIILVNSKSARKPSDAQALAQANLDGGGNTKENRRAKSPLPPSPKAQEGNQLEQAQRRVQELEAKQQRLMAQSRSKTRVAPPSDAEAQTQPAPNVSGRDLADSALAMARLEAEIAQKQEEYNKWPRKKNIGTRADEAKYARYVEDWRMKVEKVGNLNYPEAAKGKLYGSLTLTVTIKSDGSVSELEVTRSSGQKILDDAARRIVMMAAPYAAFPPNIRSEYDLLEITRRWNFTNSDTLETRGER